MSRCESRTGVFATNLGCLDSGRDTSLNRLRTLPPNLVRGKNAGLEGSIVIG